jgi:hypothetical protein
LIINRQGIFHSHKGTADSREGLNEVEGSKAYSRNPLVINGLGIQLRKVLINHSPGLLSALQ